MLSAHTVMEVEYDAGSLSKTQTPSGWHPSHKPPGRLPAEVLVSTSDPFSQTATINTPFALSTEHTWSSVDYSLSVDSTYHPSIMGSGAVDIRSPSVESSTNYINPLRRPGVAARLAAVAAFSSTRQADNEVDLRSFLVQPANLSDSPPPSLLPQPMRQEQASSQEIMPERLHLTPSVPKAANSSRPSSRKALTKALELAREAVRLDSTNNDPYGAIIAYGKSVALLNEVMERVLRGDDGSENSQRRHSGRRRSIVAQEEEVRRLKSIHDTYADRMNILSLIYSIPTDVQQSLQSSSHSYNLVASHQWITDAEQSAVTSSYQSSHEDRENIQHSNQSSSSGQSSPVQTSTRTLHKSHNSQEGDRSEPKALGAVHHNRSAVLPPIRPLPAGPLPLPPQDDSKYPHSPQLNAPLPVHSSYDTLQRDPSRQYHAETIRDAESLFSHSRNGSGSRLESLQEETLSSTSIIFSSSRLRQFKDIPGQLFLPNTSPPLPPIPSPRSDMSVPITPRFVTDNQVATEKLPSDGGNLSYQANRPRNNSALSVRSENTPYMFSLNPTVRGTISQRRIKTNVAAHNADVPLGRASPISDGHDSHSVLTNSKHSNANNRLRASSQPVRPQLPHSSVQPLQANATNDPDYNPQLNMSHKGTSAMQPDAPGPAGRNIPNSRARATTFESMTAVNLIPPPLMLFSQLPTTPTSPLPPLPPTDSFRKPFHLMNLLRHTMTSKSGGYITRRLHVPFEVWSQGGAKLNGLPEKVRVVEILCDALYEVQNASVEFCGPMGAVSGMGLGVGSVGRKEGEIWAARLEEFSAVCDDVVGTFGRKLGVGEGFVAKKSSGVKDWGLKFARRFDKLTNTKNLDSPTVYVNGLTRLFDLSQLLDDHILALSPPLSPTYAALPSDLRSSLEVKFKRTSEFFATVVLTFVVRDLSQLLDKYAKKCEKWLAD